MTVRTSTLARVKVVNATPVTAFTVPTGQTWILKNILATNNAAAAQVVQASVFNSGAVFGVDVINQSVNAGITIERILQVVMQPGDNLLLAVATGNVVYWISGTKLLGVA